MECNNEKSITLSFHGEKEVMGALNDRKLRQAMQDFIFYVRVNREADNINDPITINEVYMKFYEFMNKYNATIYP